MVDILVFNEPMHGMPASDCVDLLQDRFPERDVRFARSREEERALITDAEIVVGGRFESSLFERAENLTLFACTWAGVGQLDLEAFEEHDVAVTNAAGVHGPNIAEHVLGWFLMVTRRLDEGIRRQERGEWRHFQAAGELAGSRVCIVGLGAIGQAIAERLEGFDVETVGVRYTPEKGGPTDEVYGFDELATAFLDAEYVVIACPLTEETRGLVGREELAILPTNAVFANVGRGPIVDTDALVRALRRNTLRAACLDVTDPEPLPKDHPLWEFGNAYITPHNAGHTPKYWDRLADILEENLERLERGEDLRNRVV